MRIYLDMCALQRPLDDGTQLRILIEAEVVLGIISLCDSGQVELVSSEALIFEVSRNPHPIRRDFAYQVLARASQYVAADLSITQHALALAQLGIKNLDSLHLASAIAAKADYFCTCDDRLLNKAKLADTGGTKIVSPVELISELER